MSLEAEKIVDYLQFTDFISLIAVAFIGNFLLFLLSILFYEIIHKIYNQHDQLVARHPILQGDIWNALFNMLLNGVVAIVGLYLMRMEWMKIIDFRWETFLFKFLAVFFLIDFLMFILHWLVHKSFLYRYFHYRHHVFERTNALSLFVMHPLENLMFGCVLIITFILVPCDIFTIVFYLAFNLLWGILGHLGFNLFHFKNRLITNGMFHMHHHHDIHVNFGFYTSLWDKFFKTYK
ncbi:sterol desaturase family protein [Sphingobacterium sp. SRCM116780]|uniref:sterol desaturase family protein n=1 Tax=Sphingobacterium sp. SRCM116780 TaxID=2907623 RepID=UPI001F1E20A9|nr:sterol desaturase family protein [Sphingobacterium sp. SRCM116780]UIR56587.1 sterol desaturase family protein [Sphingobacterium sp. SRCM116780]